jgi:hypothetical protein
VCPVCCYPVVPAGGLGGRGDSLSGGDSVSYISNEAEARRQKSEIKRQKEKAKKRKK